MRDPKERLRDILEAIAAIERYLPRGREAFDIVWDAARRETPALKLQIQRLLGRLEELEHGG